MRADRRGHVVVEVPADEFCSPYGFSSNGDGDENGAEDVTLRLGAAIAIVINIMLAMNH